jgi:hypothetical protein
MGRPFDRSIIFGKEERPIIDRGRLPVPLNSLGPMDLSLNRLSDVEAWTWTGIATLDGTERVQLPSLRSSADDDELAGAADGSVPSDWSVGIGRLSPALHRRESCRNLKATATATLGVVFQRASPLQQET